MPNYQTLTSMTNSDFLTAVASRAPQFKELASKKSEEIFTAKGYEALSQIYSSNGDPVTDFYQVALLVGLQVVNMVDFDNPLDRMGLIERYGMDLGGYMQKNYVRRIKNVSPAFKGLENGDSPDQYEVRKPEIDQNYFGLNWNYQNWISLQDFDLKGGWLRENGIGEVTSQVFNMVGLDRVETEYAKFFEVLSGAINSTDHPLQNSQKLVLGAALSTESGVRAFIKFIKNVARAIEAVPVSDLYNAAKYPNGAKADKMVILVREGVLSEIEDVLGYAFNPSKLALPFDIYEVPNFGGMTLYDAATGETKLQVVYDKNGTPVGGVDALATVNGYATKRDSDGRYIVNITAGGATANTTFPEFDRGETIWVDEVNALIQAVIIEKGTIFELIQNRFTAEPVRNARGMYTNTWFNQLNNGIEYEHHKNLVTISLPSN